MKKFLKLFLICAIFLSFSCGTDFTAERSEVKTVQKESVATDSAENEAKKPSEETESETISDAEEEYIEEDEVGYEVTDEDDVEEEEPEPVAREWTILVYMAADNNLESDAITDFNEMELADVSEAVTVLVLFDRAEKYDATNGDWTDTRLYKITKDEQVNKTLISSEQLDCDELGLKVGVSCELDMANPATLAGLASFAKRAYPAENYALIIWGHGTGWRGEGESENQNYRAVAIDNASDSYMSISQIQKAIHSGMENEKLSLIGFDTCFGLCLETAYELSDCASYMLGTPGLVSESGWNYTDILTQFSQTELSTANLIEAICSSYAQTYKNYTYAAFSCLDLSKIVAVTQNFSAYAQSVANAVKTKTVRDSILSTLTENCASYCATTYPTDFYLDVYDMVSLLYSYDSSKSAALQNLLDNALYSSWSASGKKSSLGVFFCVYRAAGVVQSSHPTMYVNGSRETLLSRFVSDCAGYVPTLGNAGSFLDKLFYTQF